MSDSPRGYIRGYQLQGEIGKGGFGRVLKAFQASVNRQVAIKVIHTEYVNHPEFIRNFEREAQLVARLEHPHIVSLYDYWREPGGAYLVMPYYQGGNVRSALKRYGVWSIENVLKLLNQLTPALVFAHQHGVVHRDIKPENIVMDTANNVFLTDFGIAIDLYREKSEAISERLSFGSPMYVSPEQIVDDTITPQADIYSMGLLTFELLVGQLPFFSETTTQIIQRQIYEPLPALSKLRPEFPVELDTVIWQATAKTLDARYRDILDFLTDFHKAIGQQITSFQETLPARVTMAPVTEQATQPLDTQIIEIIQINPYVGLRSFEEGDSHYFFGRAKIVSQLTNVLLKTDVHGRFIALVGPSGSGKSSVVRSGLIPIIRTGVVPGSSQWFVITMTPGGDPLANLADKLLSITRQPIDNLAEKLAESDTALRDLLPEMTAYDDQILIVVDQFEELFTQTTSIPKRMCFLNNLYQAIMAETSQVRVVVTLRADFYDRPLVYAPFSELLQDNTILLLPMTATELEQVIEQPAIQAGLRVDPQLTATLIDDLQGQKVKLPLLQYALTELFEQHQDSFLALETYENIGGVVGSLTRRVEMVFDELTSKQKTVAQRLFLQLVSYEESGEPVRRRILQEQVLGQGVNPYMLEHVLEQFGQHRLLTFDRDAVTRSPTIELAHEALITHWDRFGHWIEENRLSLMARQRLSIATREWLEQGHDPSYLASGGRLLQFEELTQDSAIILTSEEHGYIDMSIRKRQQARQRVQMFVAMLAVISVVAVIAAILAAQGQNQAEEARQSAEEERDRANIAAAEAQSRALAAISLNKDVSGDLALLLAAQAYRTDETYEARNSLLRALQAHTFVQHYLHGHTDQIRDLVVDPSSDLLVSAGRDLGIRRWDTETLQPIGELLTGHEGWINAVAISPDGRLIASASSDNTVRLWDTETGVEVVEPFSQHSDAIWDIAFDPTGQLVLSTSVNGEALVWNVKSGEVQTMLSHGDAAVYAGLFASDNTVLTASADGIIRRWDAETGELEAESEVEHENWVLTLALDESGQTLASGGADQKIAFWDTETLKLIGLIDGAHAGWIRDLAFSPNGQLLVSSADDGSVRLWQTSNTHLIRELSRLHDGPIWSVAFIGNTQIMTADDNAQIIAWELSSPAQPGIDYELSDKPILVMDVSSSGELAARAGTESNDTPTGLIEVFDPTNGAVLHTIDAHNGQIIGLAFSPKDDLLVSVGVDGWVNVWSTEGELAHQIEGLALSLAFSPDGETLFLGTSDGGLIQHNLESKTSTLTLDGLQEGQAVTALAVSRDGALLATGGRDTSVQVWNLADLTQVAQFDAHQRVITALEFDATGSRLVSSSRDGDIMIWDINGHQRLALFDAHGDWVTDLVIDDVHSILASSGRDGQVRFWDLNALRPLGTSITAHSGWATALAHQPDSSTLYSGGRDGAFITWQLSPDDWLASACEIANRTLSEADIRQHVYFEPSSNLLVCE